MDRVTVIHRVYFLLGPELGDKGQRIKDIRNSIRAQYDCEPELYRFYPFETDNGEIFTVLQNDSLFSDYRLVILSQAENLSTQLMHGLVDYMKRPNETATLLIVSNETSLPAKLMNTVPKDHIEIFWEMFENRKSQWVRDYFRRSGFNIDEDAIQLLLELVENNTQELRNISNQIFQFTKIEHPDERTITINEQDIETYVHHTRQESPFSLFEAMSVDSFDRALSILHALLGSGETDSVPLLALLLWQFRRLQSYSLLIAHGESHEEACRSIKIAGKSSPIRRKKDQQIVERASQRYPLESIGHIIARIGEYDKQTRETSGDLQRLLLEQFVYVCMIRKGKPLQTPSFPSLLKVARF